MRTRSFLVSTALLAALAVPAGAERIVIREQSEATAGPAGLVRLLVENPRGDVEVRPSADGRVHLSALKTARASEATRAKEMSAATRVQATLENGVYRVRVEYPQRHTVNVGWLEMLRGFEFPDVAVKLAIEVPPALPVELRSTSGDIATEDLAGTQELKTTSGDVTVSRSRGRLSVNSTSGDLTFDVGGRTVARTVSGDIVVERAGAPLDLHTTSGDIAVRGSADSLRLGTVSGDVEVERAPLGLAAATTSGEVTARAVAGRLDATSSSGSIHATLVAPLLGAQVVTGSGDITVSFAAGAGAKVELRTSNGQIDADIPIEIRSVTRHLVSGQVGTGDAPVVLRSSSGDIRIQSGGK